LKTSDFDYTLPSQLIAQTPIEPRDASRLLVLHRDDGRMEHRIFRDVLEYLRPGDLLVCNDSRVIPARLYGRKAATGGKTEVMLISKRGARTWEVLARGRGLKPGARLLLGNDGALCGTVVSETETGGRIVEFGEPVEPHLAALGVMPLPPYIHEPLRDPERYQTVYSRVSGSVAAPTAGLHFTPDLLQSVLSKGCSLCFVTLHIGMDTFRPVAEENVEEHHIHTEWCEVSEEVAARLCEARAQGRRIVTVGTTSVRALETSARAGKALNVAAAPVSGPTDLYITPCYQYNLVDVMLTNFHLPRSTLLLLVCAFAGKAAVDRAYAEAIRLRYRFFSFGDAMLIL
jgi:S-adenosylmethionine:tRNA ribosyltransferase-isomerase